jgi:hypothetical protein
MKLATRGWIKPKTVNFQTIKGQRCATASFTPKEIVQGLVRCPRDLARGHQKGETFTTGEALNEFRLLATVDADHQEREVKKFLLTFGWPSFDLTLLGRGRVISRTNLAELIRWATVLDAAVQAFEVTHMRQPLRPWILDELSQWPNQWNDNLLDQKERLQKSKTVDIAVQRALLTYWLNQTLESLPTTFVMDWPERKNPELLVHGETMLATLALHVGLLAGYDDARTALCENCQQSFTQRTNRNKFCGRDDCVKARERLKKQRQRNTKGKS